MSAAYKLTRQDGAGIRSTTEVVGSDGRDVGDLAKSCFDACPAKLFLRSSLEAAAEPGCAGGQHLSSGQHALPRGKLFFGSPLWFFLCFFCLLGSFQPTADVNPSGATYGTEVRAAQRPIIHLRSFQYPLISLTRRGRHVFSRDLCRLLV